MRIGVISDTHLKGCNDQLKRIADDYFRDVDMILHAGDLVNLEVLEAFAGKEVRAVSGNMDNIEVRKHLPEKMIIELKGFKIGLIHGWGMPFGLEWKLRKKFDEIHCLIYGHTHHACNKLNDNVLYFNPGSPTDRRFAPLNTVGILEIGDRIHGKILEIHA